MVAPVQVEFTAYSMGICYASVCTNLSVAAAERKLNLSEPAGPGLRWKHADEKFRTGEDNPCPCETHPETHKHYLFSC